MYKSKENMRNLTYKGLSSLVTIGSNEVKIKPSTESSEQWHIPSSYTFNHAHEMRVHIHTHTRHKNNQTRHIRVPIHTKRHSLSLILRDTITRAHTHNSMQPSFHPAHNTVNPPESPSHPHPTSLNDLSSVSQARQDLKREVWAIRAIRSWRDLLS